MSSVRKAAFYVLNFRQIAPFDKSTERTPNLCQFDTNK